MRVLTAIKLFEEVGPSLYKGNALSDWLVKPGQADGFQLVYEIKALLEIHILHLIDRTVQNLRFPSLAISFPCGRTTNSLNFRTTARVRRVLLYGLIQQSHGI